MSAAVDLAIATALDALEVEPLPTVSEWADGNRVLSRAESREPGRWRTSRTPYLRDIMDALGPQHPAETVVFKKASQIGGTSVADNWLGYIIDACPAPVMYVQETIKKVEGRSKFTIGPMIENTPALRAKVRPAREKDADNTITQKKFAGGILFFVGANSPVGLKSFPIRFLILDEVDGYKQDIGEEGDAIELGRKRTATFGPLRKIYICSSPTEREFSRIDAAYDQTDQRVFEVPCVECGSFAPIHWRNIRWEKDNPETAALACEACGVLMPETVKPRLLAGGRWKPTAPGRDANSIGFALSSLYSPLGWFSWADAARQKIRAKGNREREKVFVNTVLGESFQEHGDRVEASPILGRLEEYSAEVPEGALVLTAGVDVQTEGVGRIEYEVVGWGEGEESWGIEYGVISGDPDQEYTWKELDERLLATKFKHERGPGLRVKRVCVDAGHLTRRVYDYAKARRARGVFAVVGRSGKNKPIVTEKPRPRTMKERARIPVDLRTVGTDEAKTRIYSRLRIEDPGPGFCHFPVGRGYDDRYFDQLTSNVRRPHFVRGFAEPRWEKPSGRRDEALDCRVYAYAALYLLRPRFPEIRRKLEAAARKLVESSGATRVVREIARARKARPRR